MISLSENSITEKQFQKELKKNPAKYIINTDYLTDISDLKIIKDIIEKVNMEMTIDEIAETFSFEMNSFNEGLSTQLALF